MGINLQQLIDNAFSEQMAASEQEIADLKGEIASQAPTIDFLSGKLAKAYEDLNRFEDEIDAKDAEVAKLQARVAELEAGQPEPQPEEPTEPEEPAPEPGGFRWPDASDTGVPAGTVLTAYSGPSVVTKDGTVIEDKIISGYFEVRAANVTIRRCKFTGGADWGINGDTARDMVIEDNEFSGMTKAILAQGTIQRNNIHGVVIGITLKDGKSLVKANFIHDLSTKLPEPHFDGIFVSGGQRDCLIEDNNIEVPAIGGTASIFIATRWAGSHIVNTTVRHNRLRGKPSYAIYVEDTNIADISGTVLERNDIERGAYGHINSNDGPDVTYIDNILHPAGALID